MQQIKGSNMAHHNTSSDSDDEIGKSRAMIFPHEKPLHEILGGGKGTPLGVGTGQVVRQGPTT
jgi:hypothetical protein